MLAPVEKVHALAAITLGPWVRPVVTYHDGSAEPVGSALFGHGAPSAHAGARCDRRLAAAKLAALTAHRSRPRGARLGARDERPDLVLLDRRARRPAARDERGLAGHARAGDVGERLHDVVGAVAADASGISRGAGEHEVVDPDRVAVLVLRRRSRRRRTGSPATRRGRSGRSLRPCRPRRWQSRCRSRCLCT